MIFPEEILSIVERTYLAIKKLIDDGDTVTKTNTNYISDGETYKVSVFVATHTEDDSLEFIFSNINMSRLKRLAKEMLTKKELTKFNLTLISIYDTLKKGYEDQKTYEENIKALDNLLSRILNENSCERDDSESV